jgi:TetR/AcrR family transcriptional regulator, tetracycline repressor protein
VNLLTRITVERGAGANDMRYQRPTPRLNSVSSDKPRRLRARAEANAPQRRGRTPRISREQIVAAALKLPREELTMQAVASELGVDRKAVNYHVGDRDGLLGLMAFELFEAELSRLSVPTDSDWQQSLRVYARALRNAAAKLGPLALTVNLRVANGLSSLSHVEAVLESLIDAGFDTHDARRIMVSISDIAFADLVEIDLIARNKVHPQVPDLLAALNDAEEARFPVLRDVVADRRALPHDEGQFDFHLESFLRGLKSPSQNRSTSPKSRPRREKR